MVTSWHGWTIGFRHKQDTGKDLGRAHGSQIRIQVVESIGISKPKLSTERISCQCFDGIMNFFLKWLVL